jgi:transcriptional regulator with XRE-family HTH domain
MTLQTPQSFNGWLRGQLKEKKMSQRQLALQSGVDHSTISRLIKGDRMPSLGTATKLARGLREIGDETDGPAYFASVAARQMLPTARVEYALRGDDLLNETDVRELMQVYISARSRRMRENGNGGNAGNGGNGGNAGNAGNGGNGGNGRDAANMHDDADPPTRLSRGA